MVQYDWFEGWLDLGGVGARLLGVERRPGSGVAGSGMDLVVIGAELYPVGTAGLGEY